MPAVRYEAPTTIADAIRLMQADPGASILAGGTDLLIQFRAGARQLSAFVDVKRIPELVEIRVEESGARIGAGAAAATICEHPVINRLWPGIVEATQLIGSTQIQGRATLGGNLCNASPAADGTCALIVNRAMCVIAGPAGERRVPVDEFCAAPGRTVLGRGEILVAVDLPRPQPGTSDAYLRLIPRSEMDIAVAGAAVSVTVDASGTCTAARVAVGAVAPTALLVAAAADALIGAEISATAIERAADAARAMARPIDDRRGTVAYRRHVVGILVQRAAATAAERARRQKA